MNRGLLYSARERYEDAAADLEQVITTLSLHPEAHMELSIHYDAFLRYAPAHPEAAEVRSHLKDLQVPG